MIRWIAEKIFEKDMHPSIDEYFNYRKLKEESKESALSRRLESIDQNASTLLTHISAMIAVLGIMIIITDANGFEKYVFIIEMLVYALCAYMCIDTIAYSKIYPPKIEGERDKVKRIEVLLYSRYIRRRIRLYIIGRMVLVNTGLFMFTLVFHVLAST